jgi:hypothetical protein
MTRKMAIVNALECKHPENEAKMHFTYLRQCSAHSKFTSKDFIKLFSLPKFVVTKLLAYLGLYNLSTEFE